MFDLADLESVRVWASRAQDFGLPLDVLVNNAGGRVGWAGGRVEVGGWVGGWTGARPRGSAPRCHRPPTHTHIHTF